MQFSWKSVEPDMKTADFIGLMNRRMLDLMGALYKKQSSIQFLSLDDFGGRTNGVSDNTQALLKVINAAPARGVIVIPPSENARQFTDSVSVDKALTFIMMGATLTMSAASTPLFDVTSSNVHFNGGKLVGPQYASQQSDGNAIQFVGASASSPISNVSATGVEIDTWGLHGVYLEHVTDFDVSRNTISDINNAGIGTVSALRGQVALNNVQNIVGSPLAYGIYFSRLSTASLTTDPRSSDISCTGNTVKDVPNWEGLDTHGGQRIAFVGNNVSGCSKGIVLGPSTNGSSPTYAPQDVIVTGNTVDSVVTDGSADVGILLQGAGNTVGSPVELATGSIIGNTVRGHGDESNSISGAIILQTTKGAIVTGNQIIEPSPHGVFLYHDNYEFVVADNPVRDAWSETQANTSALHVNSDYQTGTLRGNSLVHDTRSATHINVWGLRVGSSLSNSLLNVSGNRLTVATTPYSIQTAGAIQTVAHISPITVGASGASIKQHLSATRTWDPASVTTGTSTTVTVNVSGAALGDTVTVGFSLSLQGMQLTGYVSSSGVVTVVLFNSTAGTLDLGSGTLRADVWQH